MHTHQTKSDGAGRMKIIGSSQCLFEKGRAHCKMPGILKKSHRFAKAPERSAMRILGPDLLCPVPRISHEIAKTPIIFIIGIQKKSEIMTAERVKSPAVCPGIFDPWRQPAALWHYHRCSSHGCDREWYSWHVVRYRYHQ